MMEDGSLAGQGLTVMQTFTYFVAAPVLLFAVISFFAYITAKETRKKSKKSINPLTHIE
jgi:preprotein translocase subunit YajC